MEPLFVASCAIAAIAGAAFYRAYARNQARAATARSVEAERIIALLSSKQPGVWDQDDLRTRVAQVAGDLWAIPTLGELDRLQTWVHPDLIARVRQAWPARAARRDLKVTFQTPVSFVAVHEGGPGQDRLVARLDTRMEGQYLDPDGRRVRAERRARAATYHSWIHIDGQGWRLESIGDDMPNLDPSSSVTCRIMPQGATTGEETEASP